MSYSRILGTGGVLPKRVLTNAELEQMVDTSDQWIQDRTGIRQRHIAAEGEHTGDLADRAARQCFSSSRARRAPKNQAKKRAQRHPRRCVRDRKAAVS